MNLNKLLFLQLTTLMYNNNQLNENEIDHNGKRKQTKSMYSFKNGNVRK